MLGVSPKTFFDEKEQIQQVIYTIDDYTIHFDEEKGYIINWLVNDSNENEMEPIILTLDKKSEYKEFEPSLSDTFAYVLDGSVKVTIGTDSYIANQGETIYYQALKRHQITNNHSGTSRILLVATNSYL